MQNHNHHCPVCQKPQCFQGLCLECRTAKEQQQVLDMSKEEIEMQLQSIIANIEELNDWSSETHKMFTLLFTLRGISSPEIAEAAIRHKIYNPASIYYQAPTAVRDQLVLHLNQSADSLEANNILLCLAMQGDDDTLKLFHQWENNLQPWRHKLHVGPSVYAESGGWTFDKTGKRIDLIYPKCYPMVKGTGDSPVKIAGQRIDRRSCKACHGGLTNLLILDGRDPRLDFLDIPGILTVTCCLSCVMYDTIYASYTLNGDCELAPYIGEEYPIDEETLNQLADNGLILASDPVPLFYATASHDLERCTIGGYPNWVDDAIHTTCPQCHKKMRHLAQIPWSTISSDDGTMYIEICTACQKLSIQYQQT